MNITFNGIEHDKQEQADLAKIDDKIGTHLKKAYDEVQVCPVCRSTNIQKEYDWCHRMDIRSYYISCKCNDCNSEFQSSDIRHVINTTCWRGVYYNREMDKFEIGEDVIKERS